MQLGSQLFSSQGFSHTRVLLLLAGAHSKSFGHIASILAVQGGPCCSNHIVTHLLGVLEGLIKAEVDLVELLNVPVQILQAVTKLAVSITSSASSVALELREKRLGCLAHLVHHGSSLLQLLQGRLSQDLVAGLNGKRFCIGHLEVPLQLFDRVVQQLLRLIVDRATGLRARVLDPSPLLAFRNADTGIESVPRLVSFNLSDVSLCQGFCELPCSVAMAKIQCQ